MINAHISKTLGIPESTIGYYRKSPNNIISKRYSKLPKKYIDEIYRLNFNKAKREMPSGIIAIEIDENVKKK